MSCSPPGFATRFVFASLTAGAALLCPVALAVDAAPASALCPVPKPVLPLAGISNVEQQIDAYADHTELFDAGTARIEGNVQFRQGTRLLQAARADISEVDGRLTADGGVTVSDRNLELKGETLSANLNNSSATLTKAEYRLTDRGMHGSASQFAVTEAGLITLDNSTFTSCPGDEPAWLFSADSMRLDREEGWGEARSMRVDLGGVPVLYVPYLTFPIDDRRRSGMLVPSISNSQKTGLDITVPYYLNLAPNYDATLFPRWLSLRGLQMGAELRHLGEDSNSTVHAEVLPDDRRADDSIDSQRWLYSVQHEQNFSAHWQGVLDYNDVSDELYFADFGSNVSLANKHYLPRTAALRYQDAHWRFSAAAFALQALQTTVEPYRKLPELQLGARYPALLGPIGLEFSSSLTRFDHDTAINGERAHIAPALVLPLTADWGYARLKAQHDSTRYRLETAEGDAREQEGRDLSTYSLDSGLFAERELRLFNRELVQTLEPRLAYLRVPFVDQSQIPLFDTTTPTDSYQNLFRTNRFIGLDRIGDTEQVTLGLSTRFFAQDDGEEVLRLAIGRSRYLAERKVTLRDDVPAQDEIEQSDYSPLYTEAAVTIDRRWELRQTLGFDPASKETVRGSLALRYEPDERHVVNTEYRYRQLAARETEQSELAFYWPVSANWQVVGRYARDLIDNRAIDTMFGVEYESCCWAVRVVGRSYLNVDLDSEGLPLSNELYDRGLYFQFIFKGLGAAGGNNLRGLLTESLEGFTDRLNP